MKPLEIEMYRFGDTVIGYVKDQKYRNKLFGKNNEIAYFASNGFVLVASIYPTIYSVDTKTIYVRGTQAERDNNCLHAHFSSIGKAHEWLNNLKIAIAEYNTWRDILEPIKPSSLPLCEKM